MSNTAAKLFFKSAFVTLGSRKFICQQFTYKSMKLCLSKGVFVKPVTLSRWASSWSIGLKRKLKILTLPPVPRLWLTLLSDLCPTGRKESE